VIRRVAAQARVEILLTLRRGESLLVVAGIPVGILVFFTAVDVLPHGRGRAVDFLVPGVLALAVISSAMTSLGIATGFERQSGVLRRLGITPLGREGLLTAKGLSILAVVIVQVVAVAAVGAGLGWRLPRSVAAPISILVLGVVAFAGLGLLLAGRLRAELNLAVANALFLVFLLLGGIVVPLSELPAGLEALAGILPAEPLATSLRAALSAAPVAGSDLVTLGAWAFAACGLAAATFKWE
jgi:ABC-2 type transport system permease protein